MSVLDWVLIGAIILFFTGVTFFALGDLFRDRKYYKDKLKNIQKMSDYKQSKKTQKADVASGKAKK